MTTKPTQIINRKAAQEREREEVNDLHELWLENKRDEFPPVEIFLYFLY